MADLVDFTIQRAVDVEKYINQLANRISRLVKSTDADVIKQMAASLVPNLSRRSLDALIKRVRRLVATGLGAANSVMQPELQQLTTDESNAQLAALLAAGVIDSRPRINKRDLFSDAKAEPIDGLPYAAQLTKLNADKQGALERIIRRGWANNQSPQEIIAAARQFLGVKADRWLKSLVQTAAAHYVAQAKIEIARRTNLKFYQWVSVLDSRTTDVCRFRSGRVYGVDLGPLPPAHIGCRSTILLLTSSKAATLPSFYEWLKKKGSEIQEKVLGKTKAALFRQGKLSGRDLHKRSGAELTLNELESRHKDLLTALDTG